MGYSPIPIPLVPYPRQDGSAVPAQPTGQLCPPESSSNCQLLSLPKDCPAIILPECSGEQNLGRRTGSSLMATHTGTSARLPTPGLPLKSDEEPLEGSLLDRDWSIPDETSVGLPRPCVRISRAKDRSTLVSRHSGVALLHRPATTPPQCSTPKRSLKLSVSETQALRRARDENRGRARGRRPLRNDDKGGALVPSRQRQKESFKERAQTLPRRVDFRKVQAVHKELLEVVKLEQQKSQASTHSALTSGLLLPLTTSQGSPIEYKYGTKVVVVRIAIKSWEM